MAGIPCWEYLKCGREKDCPAYPDKGFGCWNVEGTLCRGERQGDYNVKVGSCRKKCEFYNGVMDGSIKVI
jgi:hypothetical protein